jgi:DNA-binding XRE family transcriptional regulator
MRPDDGTMHLMTDIVESALEACMEDLNATDIKARCDNLGPRLRLLRNHLGLRQDDLARALTTMGVPTHRATIAKIEKGARPLTLAEAVGSGEAGRHHCG